MSRPKYSEAAAPDALHRAERIAKAIMADPHTPEGEREWTIEDVLAVAIWRGLDRLEELYVDPRPIEAIRAQAAADAHQLAT